MRQKVNEKIQILRLTAKQEMCFLALLWRCLLRWTQLSPLSSPSHLTCCHGRKTKSCFFVMPLQVAFLMRTAVFSPSDRRSQRNNIHYPYNRLLKGIFFCLGIFAEAQRCMNKAQPSPSARKRLNKEQREKDFFSEDCCIPEKAPISKPCEGGLRKIGKSGVFHL